MGFAFAAVAAVLLAAFAVVLRRARREWRRSDELSPELSVLITSLYVLVVALLVIALAWCPLALDIPLPPALALGSLVVVGGLALAIPGYLPFRSVKQLYGIERGGLVTAGVFRFSRNPQYVGLGLMLTGAAIIARCVTGLAVALAYGVGIRIWLSLEEEHLERAFGAPYSAYRRTAPRFLGLPRTDQPPR